MLCAPTPQNIRQTKNFFFKKQLLQKNTHCHCPNCLREGRPECTCSGGVGRGGFKWLRVYHHSLPNCAKYRTNTVRVRGENWLDHCTSQLFHLKALDTKTLVCWIVSEQVQQCGAQCDVQLPLTSPPVFGTAEFGKLRAWNPESVAAFIYVCMLVCVCVIKIMAVRFLCLTHTQKSLHFVFICPNLNQNNTVFRVGRGHLKSLVRCRWLLPFWQ